LKHKIGLLLAILLVLSPFVSHADTFPKATSNFYVNDFADILSQETEAEIMGISVPLAEKTGAQIVVVTLESLDGETIESYARGLFLDWGIGDSEKHNGLLLLVTMEERQARIEVGYGLEGALPDGKTGRIQDDYLIEHFQASRYNDGIMGTYLALSEAVYDEYGLNSEDIQVKSNFYSPAATGSDEEGITFFDIILGIIVAILVLLDIIFNRGRLTMMVVHMAGRSGKGSSGGGGFGGGGGRSGGGGSTRGW
jgi:uncharacterized protein